MSRGRSRAVAWLWRVWLASLCWLVAGRARAATGDGLPPCSYIASSGLSELIPGADEQWLLLELEPGKPTGDCQGGEKAPRLASLGDQTPLLLRGEGGKLEARVERNAAGAVGIRVVDVPATLEPAERSWELRLSSGAGLGTVSLDVGARGVSVDLDEKGQPKLSVRYDGRRFERNPGLDYLHSRQSTDGAAVTTPAPSNDHSMVTDQSYVEHDVPLRIDNRVLQSAVESFRKQERQQCKEEWKAAQCAWSPCDEKGTVTCTLSPRCLCQALLERVSQCEDEIYRQPTSGPLSHAQEEAMWQCREQHRPWRVTAKTWTRSVWFYEPAWWYARQGAYDDLGGVVFAVFSAESTPLELDVALHDGQRIVYRTTVIAARQARPESLPLPLSEALSVRCNGDEDRRVHSGQTRAVSDGEVESGQCRLEYHSGSVLEVLGFHACSDACEALNQRCEQALARQRSHCGAECVAGAAGAGKGCDACAAATSEYESCRDAARNAGCAKCARQKPGTGTRPAAASGQEARYRGLLMLYGHQDIEVKIERAGATTKTVRWRLDPTEPDAEIPLPVLDASNATGVYTVTAKPRAPSPPGVIYRSASASADDVPLANGELEFKAQLRPRGSGPAIDGVRLFFTIPVDVTSVRFPASPRELSRSDSNTTIQRVDARAGFMFVAEPWNYDTGRNSLPVPLRLQTGMHLYNLGDGRFAPAFLLGGKIALPLLDLPKGAAQDQLGTDVSAGMFWEIDLDGGPRERTAHHFLVTLGLDVLSLFGSK